ncbi:helix-turn-helix domain-containing protein [bacterium]|nr:helix-turn-helix domain-containing protein [bacterium]
MTNIIYIGVLLGAVQGFFLAAALVVRKKNHTANRLLAIMVFIFAVRAMTIYLLETTGNSFFTELQTVTWPTLFLFAPLFFFYSRILLLHIPFIWRKNILHFIPALALSIQVIIYYVLCIFGKLPESVETPESSIGKILDFFFSNLFLLMGWYYTIRVYGLLRIYRRRIHEFYSNHARIQFSWLWVMTVFQFVIWGYETGIHLILYMNIPIATPVRMVSFIILTLWIYVMGYFAINLPEIFAGEMPTDDGSEIALNTEKYRKSGLDETKALEYKTKLLQFMNDQKPYTNSEITLRDLAGFLNISEHNLSEVINTLLKKNFYDFINFYRVEDAKKRLLDPRFSEYTILAIAMEAGFNSKSSFNSLFKKFTGTTPSQFRSS